MVVDGSGARVLLLADVEPPEAEVDDPEAADQHRADQEQEAIVLGQGVQFGDEADLVDGGRAIDDPGQTQESHHRSTDGRQAQSFQPEELHLLYLPSKR